LPPKAEDLPDSDDDVLPDRPALAAGARA